MIRLWLMRMVTWYEGLMGSQYLVTNMTLMLSSTPTSATATTQSFNFFSHCSEWVTRQWSYSGPMTSNLVRWQVIWSDDKYSGPITSNLVGQILLWRQSDRQHTALDINLVNHLLPFLIMWDLGHQFYSSVSWYDWTTYDNTLSPQIIIDSFEHRAFYYTFD